MNINSLSRFIYLIMVAILSYAPVGFACEKHHKHSHDHQTIIKELLTLTGISCEEDKESLKKCTKKWIRPFSKERWEINDLNDEYIAQNKARIISLLSELKMYDEISAAKKEYDYAIILGATANGMRTRLAHLAKQINQGVDIKQIVFLVSQRPRSEKVESEKVLFDENNRYLKLKKGWVKPQGIPATETEIAKFIFEQSDLPEKLQKTPVIYVDTPGKNALPARVGRASTSDTVIAWMKMKPKEGSILAISNPPYIFYQDAVLGKYLEPGFKYQTIGGPKADKEKVSIKVVLDSLAKQINNDPQFFK